MRRQAGSRLRTANKKSTSLIKEDKPEYPVDENLESAIRAANKVVEIKRMFQYVKYDVDVPLFTIRGQEEDIVSF